MTSIIGKKLGMTTVFDEKGAAVAVTVVEAQPGVVVQVKTVERDGYEAAQVGYFEHSKEKHYNKPMLGLFKKAGVAPHRTLKELKKGGLKVGDKITVEQFAAGDMVSVTGVSKGKGFQGVMKRCNYKGGPATHGSMHNRAVGSIGASSFPSRVWKGKGMPGHMGVEKITVDSIRVVAVRPEQSVILLRGPVPGGKNAVVEIRKEG